MTKIKRFSLALVLTLFALVLTAHAQTPSIEVSTDTDSVEFMAQGETRRVHVEVFSPSGELVFETNDSDGQSIRWAMTNQKGERVADGVYLATITVVDSAGKRRKRIEQVTVSSPQYAAQAVAAPQESLAPTGAGTAGKIAKWTTATNLGNSVITENTFKLGINTTAPPTAVLQVNGLQPAALANTGSPAAPLLQTTGGKGGNTTVSGKSAGAGASISLVAGNGGDGPSGSAPGTGGSITLQPGSGGAAPGAGAKSGNVLLGPSGVGNVGIGTTAPASKFHVVSAGTIPPRLQSNETTGFTAGWDFYHGTVGKGYVGVPGTGVGSPGPGELILYSGTGVSTSLWAGGVRGITLSGSRVGIGTANPTHGRLHVIGGSDTGVYATGTSTGVYGEASYSGGFGVYGLNSSTGIGVYGYSQSGKGVVGSSLNGTGVTGTSSSGYAGHFQGKAKVTGALEVGSCTGCTISSDQNLKANFSAVNPRSILDKLVGIPLSEWNYKGDEPSVRHLGPMAQDFRTAFSLGKDDKHIDMIDANGVTMASIQALYQLMLEKDKQNQELSRKVERLQAQLAQQQAQLSQVRRTIKRRRAAGR